MPSLGWGGESGCCLSLWNVEPPGEADCWVPLSWGWIGEQGGGLGDLLESLVA